MSQKHNNKKYLTSTYDMEHNFMTISNKKSITFHSSHKIEFRISI
jgi:hypothetical protein